MNEYYVYVFLREDRYTPYYVGKGKGNRCYSTIKRGGRRPPSDKSRVVKVKEGMTEEESFQLEKILILFWGRKDIGTGILHNLTDGGEGCSGLQHTEETKKKMGLSMKGKKESEKHKKWRGQLVSKSLSRRPLEKVLRQTEHKLDTNTQRQPIFYEGTSYRSLNECSREMMKKYGLSRNTILRYIKEGRSLSDTKYNMKYSGSYTGTKYL